ncbi:hypothetical protein ZWY2020_043804 [Hordeum vulgare]|nr:hypothetical protein ZWY2020_043804 [Hordeum vulgare]
MVSMGTSTGSRSGAVVWREIASSQPPGFGRPTGSVGGTASRSERPSPAQGLAAARPSSTHSGGTKSATRTDMLVGIGMEADCDNLEWHGPMVLYHNRRIVPSDEGIPTNAVYVHERCMVWAPEVESNGDTFKNVENEINRAKRLRCSRCKLRGAALGCYDNSCRKTYHVPCAMMILECRWDVENFRVWCPKHAARDEKSPPTMESDTPSLVLQNQYLVKGGTSVLHRREDLQVDQLNTSSSSLPQGVFHGYRQCSDKERISANYRREEKLVNHSSTPVDQWVLLGVSLSASEKDSLKEFASLTSSILAEAWDRNVTHVIVGRNAGDACGKSYEVQMAILSGKWIVTFRWIMDCLVEPIPDVKTCLEKLVPGPEISYEVNFCDGSRTSGYGPTKGRARAAERAPKLFSGLHFCLSAYMDPEDRETIRGLVAAGGGQVLEGISPDRLHENLNRNPAEVYFIYDSSPPRKITSDFDLILGKEIQESIEYAKSGAHVISHMKLHDAILCYDARILERRLHEDM